MAKRTPGKYIDELIDRYGWRPILGLSLAIVILGPVAIAIRGSKPDAWNFAIGAVVAIAVIGQYKSNSAEIRRLERKIRAVNLEADEAKTKALGTLYWLAQHILVPSVDQFDGKFRAQASFKMADGSLERIRGDILSKTRLIFSRRGEEYDLQVNYYRFYEQDGSRSLVRVDATSGQARAIFDSSTEEGKAAVENMWSGKPAVCPNVSNPPPELHLDMSKKRDYVSFISVPVGAGENPDGMLSINSNVQHHLTAKDVWIVKLMASFLGLTEGVVKR